MVEAFAPAKINLTLHVTGRRGDGYHLLDSLVVFADVGDRITVAPADALTLTLGGPMQAGVPTDCRNLVVRAARAMGVSGAAIHLDKHLPAASGLGGGSSDAAAAMRALADLTGCALPPDRGLSLGADVPVCILARSCRMQGVGEVLTALRLPPLHLVLVNARIAVPTGAVFQGLERRDNPPMPDRLPGFADCVELANWLRGMRNDLENPARAAVPAVDQTLEALRQTGCLIARMSGSGATCFGLYRDAPAAERARAAIARTHPGWWCAATSA